MIARSHCAVCCVARLRLSAAPACANAAPEAGIKPGLTDAQRAANAAAFDEEQREYLRNLPENRKRGGKARKDGGKVNYGPADNYDSKLGVTTKEQVALEKKQGAASKPTRGKAQQYADGGAPDPRMGIVKPRMLDFGSGAPGMKKGGKAGYAEGGETPNPGLGPNPPQMPTPEQIANAVALARKYGLRVFSGVDINKADMPFLEEKGLVELPQGIDAEAVGFNPEIAKAFLEGGDFLVGHEFLARKTLSAERPAGIGYYSKELFELFPDENDRFDFLSWLGA